MITGVLLAVVMQWSAHFGVDPNLVCAIIQVENPDLNPRAVNVNRNGTKDLGIMQLNSSWFKHPEWYDINVNVYHGVAFIAELQYGKKLDTWDLLIAYNCGYWGWKDGPPPQSIDYAAKVATIYYEQVGKNVYRSARRRGL